MSDAGPDLGRFADVDVWIFDLDNTLYPPHSGIHGEIGRRITAFIERHFQIPEEEATVIRRDLFVRYGTTLRGLMEEHGVPPGAYLDYVDDVDPTVLPQDPRLAEALKALPGRRFILTNASRGHAERVSRHLGIIDHFEEIFDIAAADYVPKPNEETFARVVRHIGGSGEKAAMFEDQGRNLIVPAALGMATVLVVPPAGEEHLSVARGAGAEGDHIHFRTDDLGGFLESVLAAIAEAPR